ncbi:MAG: tetratricopeptide repeat protein [Thermodesulfovibrionales bacterium]|nr:tetratricopeptide repeat protein [Thermodesulfovibrionales bacterium]
MRLDGKTVFLVLGVLGLGVYANSFENAFQFDDLTGILKNPEVHNPFEPFRVFKFWPTRFLNYWSISWNYYISGEKVFSYHLVQIILHLLNAFLVFKLIEALSKAAGLSERGGHIALFGSLVFLLHPVQSQPVNYISQGAVLLASFFYLGATLFYLRYRFEGKKKYYFISLASAALSAFGKETAATLPIALLILEFTVLGIKGKPDGLRARLWRLSPFAFPLIAGIILTVWRRMNWGQDFTVAEADAVAAGIGTWDYFVTQLAVIKTYLRLFVLPLYQRFDYDYPIYDSFLNAPVFFSALLHIALIGAAVFSWRSLRLRLFSLGIIWFYITLLVESSFMPIFDLIFEHRMYLPLAGLSMAAASLVFMPGRAGARKALMVFACAALLSFSALTVKRNAVWRTEVSLWEESRSYAPQKARVRHLLGLAYKKEGRYRESAEEFQAALASSSNRDCIRSKYELSNAFFLAGMYEDSAKESKEVLGLIYKETGMKETGPVPGFKGTPEQMAAIKRFSLWKVHNNLGTALLRAGHTEEAIAEYRKALYLNPGYLDGKNSLGLALMNAGAYEEARKEFEALLKAAPDYALAHESLGLLYLEKMPDREKALYHFRETLRLIPEHPEKDWIGEKIQELSSSPQPHLP